MNQETCHRKSKFNSLTCSRYDRFTARSFTLLKIAQTVLLALLLLLVVPLPAQTLPQGAVTLFPTSSVPRNADAGADSSVELGIRFSSSVAGQVLGLRFYKSANNIGLHTGHLWSASGGLLAAVTFANESSSGWQQALFSSPISIDANTTYVVSYHCPAGHYASDRRYFYRAYTAQPLSVPSNGSASAYGSTPLFPQSTTSTNYWVDLIFIPSATAITISPTSASLQPGATQQFSATVTDTSNSSVTWTANGGTIDSAGLYTAGSTPGTYSVTSTSQAYPSESATANVTIADSNTMAVNFDTPACPSSHLTTYGGINWAGYPWGCEKAGYANDATTTVSWSSQITTAKFSFVSPSVLVGLSAGGGYAGNITLSTDAGETKQISISTVRSIASYQTGFTKPCTTVTISYGFTGAQGWTLELDDLAYTTNTSQIQIWSLSGNVSPATNGVNTTLTLGGAATGRTTADSGGNFTFSNLGNGNYAVTPSKSGFSFSPAAATAVVNGANISGINFVSTAASSTYTLSGVISPASLSSAATVVLSGSASANTQVNSDGTYSFSGLANGTYSVSPSKNGVVFSPTSQSVTIAGSNAPNVNFAATTASKYSVSGTLSPAIGGAGATITLSGTANAITVANGAGFYTFNGLYPGNYVVTPGSSVASFAPSSQELTVSNASVDAVNFTASNTADVVFFDNFAATTLSPDWTVISRHGEYSQSETECNVPQQISVNDGLTISAAAQSWVCGDFNIDGSVRHIPSTWPYITGDIQWSSFNFTYGTVEIRGKFPVSTTRLWPAFWLLGSNCQQTNPYTADVGYASCPSLSSPSYAEIDMVECFSGTWCQLSMPNLGSFHTCYFPVDANYHIYKLTWSTTRVSVAVDGKSTGCSFTSPSLTIPSTPMFLIMQIQTGGLGGTPNDSQLPSNLNVDYVRVTQP